MGTGLSEEHEDFLDVAFNVLLFLADDVESHSLREGSALSYSHNITNLEAESWGAVSGQGSVAFLEPVVLLDVVKVVTSDDNGALHFS